VDQQKKQKILIAVVAVAVLGAGGVYGFRALNSSGGRQDSSNVEGEKVKRKERKVSGKDAAGGRKTRKTRAKATASKSVERKARKKISRKGSTRRGKTRSKAKRLKKTDMKPMG